jgi:hypothetical protein
MKKINLKKLFLKHIFVRDLSNNALTYLPQNIFADTLLSSFPSSSAAKGNPWKLCSTGRNDKALQGSSICSSPQALV